MFKFLLNFFSNTFLNPIVGHVTLQRLTGMEESVNMSFNVRAKNSVKDFEQKLSDFGGVLHARMVTNNQIILDSKEGKPPSSELFESLKDEKKEVVH